MHKTPAQREIEACRYWMDRETAKVEPKVIVATYHPSFVLRAPDQQSREKAYRAIVNALREAHRLIDRKT